MGPGRTAPPGLYVLPWTSYYFDADVRRLNFYKYTAAEGREAGNTCCARDFKDALLK